MFFGMVYESGQIFLPFCHNARVWRTDRQTEFSSQYRVCITCSAVKMRYNGFHAKLVRNLSFGREPVGSYYYFRVLDYTLTSSAFNGTLNLRIFLFFS